MAVTATTPQAAQAATTARAAIAGWRRLALPAALSVAAVVARFAGWPSLALLLGTAALGAAMLPRLRGAAYAAMLLALGGLCGLALAAGPAVALQALPVLGTLLLAGHFGATLRPGRQPLISHYTRHDFGHLPPECVGYTRRLTQLWTLALASLAATQAWLLATGTAAGPVLAGSGLAMLALFLGEHVVRSLRFPQFGLATPLRTGRAILAASRATPVGAPGATSATEAPVAKGPVASGPVASGPVASGPVAYAPVATVPLPTGPVATRPVASMALPHG